MFSAMWLACTLGVFTTLSMWRFVLSDFPELDMSVTDLLNDLRQGKYSYNLVLFLILSATGFLQYCLIDRNSDQLIEVKRDPKYVTGQVWRSRFLGLMMMLPALLILANAFNLDPQAFSMFGSLALVLVFRVSELIVNDSLLLLGLLVLGTRKIVDSRNSSLNHVPIKPQAFFAIGAGWLHFSGVFAIAFCRFAVLL